MVHRIHIPEVVLSGPDTELLYFGLQPEMNQEMGNSYPKTNQTPKRTTQDLPELKAKTCKEECYPG